MTIVARPPRKKTLLPVWFFACRESLQQTRNWSLEQAGSDTDAAPIARLWSSGEQGKATHVEYWLRFEGRTYAKQVNVPLRIWKTFRENGKLRVRFVPSNPEVNHPGDWEKRPLSIGWRFWRRLARRHSPGLSRGRFARKQPAGGRQAGACTGYDMRVRQVRHSGSALI